ncbi:MAG: undecaprenyl-diphosphate phosphatase [Geobacteraceae bacterium]|jgi:undecaprenyl-diphosphatase
MTLLKILVLAAIQGAAELLPVSSSAHVIVAAKLMGLDPTMPAMTFLLIMLHTGTMFAVILYFWNSWKTSFFDSRKIFWNSARLIVVATAITGGIGITLKSLIERVMFRSVPHAEIELLFGNLSLIAAALAAVGIFIIYAGIMWNRSKEANALRLREASWIGAVQGFCLPFRGFSRSGATISTGLLLGIARTRVEEFSFVLAVVLTPPLIVREVLRLLNAHVTSSSHGINLLGLFYPGLLGMVLSFISGLLALRWLSRWLEDGRWHFFGFYCLCASVIVFLLHRNGF